MQIVNEKQYKELFELALNWLEQGESRATIEKRLLEKNADLVLITVVIKEAKTLHYANLRKQGFRLISIGCITGLSGFLITLLNFNANRSIDFALYGLTTIGIASVFWGLFKIIG